MKFSRFSVYTSKNHSGSDRVRREKEEKKRLQSRGENGSTRLVTFFVGKARAIDSPEKEKKKNKTKQKKYSIHVVVNGPFA